MVKAFTLCPSQCHLYELMDETIDGIFLLLYKHVGDVLVRILQDFNKPEL